MILDDPVIVISYVSCRVSIWRMLLKLGKRGTAGGIFEVQWPWAKESQV